MDNFPPAPPPPPGAPPPASMTSLRARRHLLLNHGGETWFRAGGEDGEGEGCGEGDGAPAKTDWKAVLSSRESISPPVRRDASAAPLIEKRSESQTSSSRNCVVDDDARRPLSLFGPSKASDGFGSRVSRIGAFYSPTAAALDMGRPPPNSDFRRFGVGSLVFSTAKHESMRALAHAESEGRPSGSMGSPRFPQAGAQGSSLLLTRTWTGHAHPTARHRSAPERVIEAARVASEVGLAILVALRPGPLAGWRGLKQPR